MARNILTGIAAGIITLAALTTILILIGTSEQRAAVAISPAGPVAQIGVDTDVSGNAANTVGTLEGCGLLPTVGSTLNIDIVVKGVPAEAAGAGGLAGYQFQLLYDPSVVEITGADSVSIVSVIRLYSDLLPDADGSYVGASVTFNPTTPAGDGVLERLTLTAIGPGTSRLVLVTDNWVNTLNDSANNTYAINSVSHGDIGVGEACQFPTPSPPPTPTVPPASSPTTPPIPPDDADGDTIADSSDNCPNAFNPDQSVPPWTVPSGDADCDGFDTTRETAMGTLSTATCNLTATANDEAFDAWPLDLNDDQRLSITDVLSIRPSFGQAVPPAPARHDINQSNSINTSDFLAFKPWFLSGWDCARSWVVPALDTDGDGIFNGTDPDDDNDGILDGPDNCDVVANAGQEDNDSDTYGDACDPDDDNDGIPDVADSCPAIAEDFDGMQDADGCPEDDDGDGVPDASDNCRYDSNPGQENNDGDGLGDACDPDDDNDGVLDGPDNCDFTPNAGQENTDGDADGDACDADDDNDGLLDGPDNCPGTPSGQTVDSGGCSAAQVDQDFDGTCDPGKTSNAHCVGSDNCPTIANADQEDNEGDGLGDACDPDDDNDGVLDGPDNCDFTPNAGQENADGDADGDACDADDDNDGVLDGPDNCDFTPNPWQENADGDADGDACDPDDDNDGVSDIDELGSAGNPPGNLIGSDPLDPASTPELCDTVDNDLNEGNNEGHPNTDVATIPPGDLLEDCIDPDDDNDQFPDIVDNCDTVVNVSQMDINGDGEGDACDDSDGDGVMDDVDNCLVAWNSDQVNSDADPNGDACDADDDNDTVIDIFDNCDTTPNPGQADIDADGEGDACDDTDSDGVVDATDNCLLVLNPDQLNADGDSLGNACEPDDDADGIFDSIDGTWDGFAFTDESQTFSNFFTDQHLGGVTYGEVLDRGTIYAQISELPNPEGMLVWGVGSGSPAMVRQICDLADLTINGGAATTVGCTSSVVFNVIMGTVTTRAGNLTVQIPTGASAVIEESGSGYSVSVPSDSPGGVTVNGATLTPGTTDEDNDDDGFLSSVEAVIGTNPNLGCGVNAWPADFNDDHVVSISDVLALKPVYGQSVPNVSVRFDITPSGSINISDVLSMKFVFGLSCTP